MNQKQDSWFQKDNIFRYFHGIKSFDIMVKNPKYFFNKPFAYLFGTGKCIRCGKKSFGIPLCLSCRKSFVNDFSFRDDRRCIKCGKILLNEDSDSLSLCTSCLTQKRLLHIDRVFPIYPYRLWRKQLLFEWKMKAQRQLSFVFADTCDCAIKTLSSDNLIKASGKSGFGLKNEICIVPVPPRPGKIRRTGWDQVDELSNILSRTYGYRVEKILQRFSSEQQKKKNLLQRQNCSNAYGLSERYFVLKNQNRLPLNVLLLDDLVTTGSTVDECARLLKENGIINVSVLSLFIVD